MKITQVAVSDLVPYAGNARLHPEWQVGQIAASITEFGFCNPILVGSDGVIIAGHGRVLAAQSLGMETVPVVRLDHLTPVQQRALVIADNKIGENAGWDEDMLRRELAALQDEDFDLSLTGFGEDELAEALAGLDPDRVDDPALDGDPDFVPDVTRVPVSKSGMVWALGKHRLMCGDATDRLAVEALVGQARMQACWTDPPYNVDYEGSAGNAQDILDIGEVIGFHGGSLAVSGQRGMEQRRGPCADPRRVTQRPY